MKSGKDFCQFRVGMKRECLQYKLQYKISSKMAQTFSANSDKGDIIIIDFVLMSAIPAKLMILLSATVLCLLLISKF